MYSTCLFCNADLGRNEVVEAFPVGSRLAFDGARGRLWVVCRACERWNLSPLEERWEAIEECERLFANTRLRVSTENIGLARLAAGLEVVRVGNPLRPELAAWRYGDQFGRRRRRNLLKAGAGLGAVGLAVAGSVTAGISIVMFGGLLGNWVSAAVKGNPKATVAHVRTHDGQLVKVRRKELSHARLIERDQGAWSLVIADPKEKLVTIDGAAAHRAAASLLPALNRYGGTRQHVARAVNLLSEHDSAARFLAAVAHAPGVREPKPLVEMTYPMRLAIEMALHEDTERRALEGELAVLEQAWRDAEEIAAISDDLLLSDRVTRTLARLRS